MVTIKKVNNGYVVSFRTSEEVYTELQEVFERLLLHFEGLASTFTGDMHGTVIVQRGASELCMPEGDSD